MQVRRVAALAGALVFGVLAICGAAVAATDGWAPFQDITHGVSIEMPGPYETKPDAGTGANGAYEGTTTKAFFARGVAFLSITDYRREVSGDIWAGLETQIAATSKFGEAEILSQRRVTIDGVQCVDAVMYNAREKLKFRLLLAGRGHTFYQVLLISSGELAPEADRFFASLHFTQPQPPV